MQTQPSKQAPAEVAARLRAAGCVYAEEEAVLLVEAARSPGELDALVARRVAGLPLEQLLGWVSFCGLRWYVDPGVFVPRRRTELLVHAAVTRLGGRPRPVVLDLCCGCGALGAATVRLLGLLPDEVELLAADVDPAAVRCARRNVEPLGGRVFQGDLYAPLPGGLRGRVDVLLANVPYVPSEAIALMPPEARSHEPRGALDGGADGLDVARRVAAGAATWLAPGGTLLVEASRAQAPALAEVFARHGLDAAVVVDEELDALAVTGTRR